MLRKKLLNFYYNGIMIRKSEKKEELNNDF